MVSMASEDPAMSDVNKAIRALIDGEEDFKYSHYSNIDTTKIPEELHRNAKFNDGYVIGRTLQGLRAKLHYYYYGNSSSDDDPDLPPVKIILDDMLIAEIRLSLIQICPEIVIQMKQERKRLANRYFDPDDENLQEEDSGEDSIGSENVYLSLNDVNLLESKLVDWLYITSQEFKDLISFTVSQETRLDLSKIINDPSVFFEEEVWEWMDELSREDFKEACRCLAFKSPTASVMLSLRSAEHNLRKWYEYDTDREIEQRTWGQVVGELEDVYDEVENRPPVLSNLDYLKQKRNAVSHPEDSPSERSAERMLYRVEGTISEIYYHMEIGD